MGLQRHGRLLHSDAGCCDKGLKIVDATCDHGDQNGRFLCQVSFVSEDDPDKRLYFDIVSAAHTDKGWMLTSGLCKR
jgi:hypothetical protein